MMDGGIYAINYVYWRLATSQFNHNYQLIHSSLVPSMVYMSTYKSSKQQSHSLV